MGGLALLMLALTAAPAAARKPDLVVKSATMIDPVRAYVFHDSNPQVSFKARTANVGRAVAPRSTTWFELSPYRSLPESKDALFRGFVDVPRLKPGESYVGKFHRRLDDVTTTPYDHYFVFACADREHDVAESDETNNCHYTGRTLDVIARRFVGNVGGNSEIGYGPRVKESWIGNLTFSFDPQGSANGYYRYLPTGTLTYTVSGSDSTCMYNGTGKHAVDGTEPLNLDYANATYGGNGSNFAPFFTYVQDCGKLGKTTHYEGSEASWWVTGQGGLFFDVHPFKLVDTYDYFGVHWLWNLEAQS